MRRSRLEQHNQIQRLVDERATAVRERDDAVRQAEDARIELIRYQVAADKGISLKQAGRLHGGTRDEIEEDAEVFIRELNPGPPVAGRSGFDGGARQPMPTPMSPEVAHNDLLLKALGRKPSSSPGLLREAP